jgi:antitoxin VapB
MAADAEHEREAKEWCEGLISDVADLSSEMPKTKIARLFWTGRSQAVRLPREFRFEGDRVRIRRVGQGVLLEPIIQDTKEWFRKLDELNSEPFPSRNEQPPTPERKIFE